MKRSAAYRNLVDGPHAEEIAFDAVAEVRPRRVLEVGCGTGDFAARVKSELDPDDLIVIDLSPRMVELSAAAGLDARVGDVQALTFDDESFDCVIAGWVLYHVEALEQAILECRRVLRPGGTLVAATLGVDNLHEVWELLGDSSRDQLSFSRENGIERAHAVLRARRAARRAGGRRVPRLRGDAVGGGGQHHACAPRRPCAAVQRAVPRAVLARGVRRAQGGLMPRLDDPELVRREYADESRFAVRAAAQQASTGPDPKQVAFEAVAEVEPRRVLEVGPGRGEVAERIARELRSHVTAVDQSERMVELTRARGIETIVGDVQALPFADASFDCALAAWMLYHVPDLDRGLAELARVLVPGGRLVAVTNTDLNLPELWGRFGAHAVRTHSFNAENGAAVLERHFARVERRDVEGTVTFPDWEAARRYVASSVTRADLAERLQPFDGPLVCRRLVAVFVAETVR